MRGRRLSLNDVARGTLGVEKSGSGLDAIRWWQDGEIARLRRYCLSDVKITKEIFDYALAHNEVKYVRRGVAGRVPFDISAWKILEEMPRPGTLF